MAKFDVNKIIEDSLYEINIGAIGDKVYDKLHPEDPNSPENIAFKHAQAFSKATKEGDVEKAKFHAAGLKKFFSKTKNPNALTYDSDEYTKEPSGSGSKEYTKEPSGSGSKEYTKEPSGSGSKEVMEKAVKSDAAKKAAEENEISTASTASKAAAKEAADTSALGQKALAKNTEDTTSVLSHLGKSVQKVGDDVQSGVKSFGHKTADYLGNLDYGKTALAGSAIAAGLGALALRRRMKKAQQR